MKTWTSLLLLPLSAGLILATACGETTTETDGGTSGGTDAGTQDSGTPPTLIAVSGVAAVHPVSLNIDNTLSIDGVTLTLEDPAQILAGRDGTLKLGDGSNATITLSADATTPSQASYSFTDVDTSDIVLGLIGTMDDAGNTYVKTSMGLAAGPQKEDLTVGHPLFVVSAATEGALSQLTGQSPGDLQTAGWILGMFIDDQGNPVDGVTLEDANGAIADAVYPNATFDGVESDGNTSPNGLFVVWNKTLSEYTGTKTGMTCASQQAATSAGSAFIVALTCTAN